MHLFRKLLVLLVWAGLASSFALNAFGQGTAFTYQGQLTSGGKAANGSFDMEFSLFNAATSGTQVGSTVTKPGVGVTNGLFTVQADFGAAPYNGQALWLQIAVSPAGSNTFTALSPLQPLTSTPYAVQALSATTVPNSGLPANPTFSGGVTASSFTGNGSSLTDLNGMQLTMNGSNLGNQNFFVGSTAGNTTTTGQYNTAFGIEALIENSSGSYNTAFGYFALEGNTTGIENTATGDSALLGNGTGSGNTADGYAALYHNNSGYNNTAFGAFALNQLGMGFGGSGSNNIAIGLGAGYSLSSNETGNIDIGNSGVSGDNNIIRIGTPGTHTNTFIAGVINGNGAGLTNLNAGQLVSSGNTSGGNYNFFVGPSGNAATSGGYNTAIGALALLYDTSGSYNTANGTAALISNTTGSGNTANGLFTLFSNTSGSFNTADGYEALWNITSGSGNTSLGDFAGGNVSTGSSNIAIGARAGGSFTLSESNNIDIGNSGVSGDNNIIRIGTPGTQTTTYIAGAINGNGAGLTNLNPGQLTGAPDLGNFFVGSSAGNTTSGGFDNTALGVDAFTGDTSGYVDTAVGFEALQNNTSGYGNTATGVNALYQNSTGNENTAYGFFALYYNTSGNDNTALGAGALGSTGGNNNIAIGYNAGEYYFGNESGNIDIGNTGVDGDNNIIRIGTPGTHTNTFIAGVINGNGAGLTNLSAAQLISSGGGVNNFFVGPSGNAATSGNCNTAIGVQALNNDTTGSFNTANGFEALDLNTTGAYNTANGVGALDLNTTGTANTANGYEALGNNSSGSGNIALGEFAGQYITNGNNNIDIGNNGVAGDNNIIRIGTPGTHTNTYIAGVINGNGVALSGPSHLSDNAIYLRGGTDTNHGLAYAGTGVTNFGPFQPDGPVLWGFTGGILGTIKAFGPTASLSWYNSGVTVNGTLVASNGSSGVIAQFANASAVVCTVSNNGSVAAAGTVYANGVALTSDRNAKENFAAVDASSVLAKVAAMPISEWNYKTDPADKKHLGPMAQDFQTAFGLDGNDSKHISMVDEEGVALAAIQGLNQKVEARDALIQKQAAEIADLKARLNALERLIKQNAEAAR